MLSAVLDGLNCMLQDFLRVAGKKDTTHSRAVSSRIFYELQEKKTPSLVGQRVSPAESCRISYEL